MAASNKVWKWVVGGLVLAVVLVVGGTWLYLNVFTDDAPKRLALNESGGSATTVPGGDPSAPLDGTWKVATGSQAGYRVKEVLFGQSKEAVGRTTAVTGEAAIAGDSVNSANVIVDLTKVTSDESRRDGQFQGRIMNTATYPTATFKLTQPIALPSTGGKVTVKATGELTTHGTTKSVTADIQAQRNGGTVQVTGSIPVVFADYNIPNPSNFAAKTEDKGLIEFLLNLQKA
jgi:polyisoprenoid-binding protein YceI